MAEIKEEDIPFLKELDPKLAESMARWFAERGVFDRVRKMRAEQEAEQKESAS